MKYGKLVRDKIPDIIKASGKIPVTRILDDKEYLEQLERKLDEEVAEFHESKSLEELADILEVVYALSEAHENIYNLLAAWDRKSKTRGGFLNKVFLIEVQDRKTYRQDFLEKFPNAEVYKVGCLKACRDHVYGTKSDCVGGCEKCWNEPMEEK